MSLHPALTFNKGPTVSMADLQAAPRAAGEVDAVVGAAEPARERRERRRGIALVQTVLSTYLPHGRGRQGRPIYLRFDHEF